MTAETGLEALHANVRSAVATELTTLPLYLYPYWSIKPAGAGGSAAAQSARSTIMAVIAEEMLHMALASNLLNALGGSPCFTEAPYLPPFPGKLLRTIERPRGWGIDIDLLPLSEAALAMMIGVERPEWDGGPTIGQFYDTGVVALLPPDDSSYAGGRQLAPWDNPGAGRIFDITSKALAQRAITEILDEGEGLSEDTHDDGYHELAHYWRFRAIQDSVANGSLDLATDVYPIIASPALHVGTYSPAQRAANEAFNRTYSRMLDALEQVLSGDRPDVYPVATGLMEKLHHQAALLRQTGPIPGTQSLPGPTFEYVPAEA